MNNLIVIGALTPTGLEVADAPRFIEATGTRFDSDTETWTVTCPSGQSATARIVVDTRPSPSPAIAVHGVPNYFRIPGPDTGRQARYVTRCLRMIERSGASRVEARGTVVAHRWRPQAVASRFYLSGSEPGPDDLYDGPATVTVGGRDIASRVRLIGHLDAIDGRYHWQGTVFGPIPDSDRGRAARLTLTIGECAAAARVVEQTPWGTHMVAGIGDPPFAH